MLNCPDPRSIDSALTEIRSGRPVIVIDDPDRESEAELVMAAERVTAERPGFIVRRSSGITCAAMTGAQADTFELPPMVADNEDPRRTAYTVTVDRAENTSTGVSGADRAINLLATAATRPDDLRLPAQTLPRRARDGDVIERHGHTAATVHLCRLAECEPVGLLAEVMRDDGETICVPKLLFMTRRHRLPEISIADLVAWQHWCDPAAPQEVRVRQA